MLAYLTPVASATDKFRVIVASELVTSTTDGEIPSGPGTGPDTSTAWAGDVCVSTNMNAKQLTRSFFIDHSHHSVYLTISQAGQGAQLLEMIKMELRLRFPLEH